MTPLVQVQLLFGLMVGCCGALIVLCWKWRQLFNETLALLKQQKAISEGLYTILEQEGIAVVIEPSPDLAVGESRLIKHVLPHPKETRH